MQQTVSIWPFLLVAAVALVLLVTNWITLRIAGKWQDRAILLEVEANDAADRLTQAHKDVQYQSDLLVALNERVDAQDELIASLTAQRDNEADGYRRVFQLLRPAEDIVAAWNHNNPSLKFGSVANVLAAAYVHGPRGRLTRLVPKVPTNG